MTNQPVVKVPERIRGLTTDRLDPRRPTIRTCNRRCSHGLLNINV
jgi:hypothetical protein